MTDEKLPKGFACNTCGKFHEFSVYVYAHWDLLLTHTCDACGAKHEVQKGHAIHIKEGANQVVGGNIEK